MILILEILAIWTGLSFLVGFAVAPVLARRWKDGVHRTSQSAEAIIGHPTGEDA